jgi:hypothetical protein
MKIYRISLVLHIIIILGVALFAVSHPTLSEFNHTLHLLSSVQLNFLLSLALLAHYCTRPRSVLLN